MEISRRTYRTSLWFGSFLCRTGLLRVGRPPHSQSSYRHVVFFAEHIPFNLLVLPSFAWRTIAVQAGRDLRVIVDPAAISDDEAGALARTLCREISERIKFPGQIRVTVVRELRCMEYAK